MEALTDDIVFSLSAFLRPHDLLHLALASRRFGGSPGGAENGARLIGADAEERAAKRQRLDANRAGKREGCADDGSRRWPLMYEVAWRLVEGHRHFSSELLQRKGGESWMAALHRLEGQQQLIEEAMAAAPAIFAKPGDIFRLWDKDSRLHGEPSVRYVGRKEGGWQRGWLVFNNLDNTHNLSDNEVILDNLGVLGPRKIYHYAPSGPICLPPEHCGAFNPADKYDDLGLVIAPKSTKIRAKELCITPQMLLEAKKAAPVLTANPGDLFQWNQNRGGDSVLLRFVGRNAVPSKTFVRFSTPQVGWLVFHDENEGHTSIDVQIKGGIRDGIRAWPDDFYSHHDSEGRRIRGTLCIPHEKCGALNALSWDD